MSIRTNELVRALGSEGFRVKLGSILWFKDSTLLKKELTSALGKIDRVSAQVLFKKGGLAVLDQSLFSGANFLVNILLARWLPPEEYGAFAVALSVFYLLANFHTALLTEPMMVFGAGKYREHFRKYFGILLYGHWGLSMLIGLLLAGVAIIMRILGSEAMAQALAGLALGTPFFLLIWLVRRAPYVEMLPIWAVAGSAVYLISVLVGTFSLWQIGLLTSFSGLILLGFAGGIGALTILARLRPQMRGFVGNPTPAMVKAKHITYGRWSLGTVVLMWLPGNIAYTLLPLLASLEAAAVVRAVMNFIFPILHAISALSVILVTHFSRLFSQRQFDHLRRSVIWFAVTFFVISLGYAAFITVFRNELFAFAYGAKYEIAARLVPVASILPVAAGLNAVFGGALRAMEMPKLVFLSYVWTAFVGLTIGVGLIAYFGTYGAVWSMIITAFTTSTVMIVHFLRRIKQEGA